MLSMEHSPPPWPPCPARFNLAAHALRAGAAGREALLVLGPGSPDVWSHDRLEAAVRGCGTGLVRQGLKPGDRVLMRMANSVSFPILFLGAIAVGLVPVPSV
jgi:acyl-CoA synthetase (AMP-forming)/AMP-acid ligase II